MGEDSETRFPLSKYSWRFGLKDEKTIILLMRHSRSYVEAKIIVFMLSNKAARVVV